MGELDWRTTFLPQFEACVRAGSYSFMCSYNRCQRGLAGEEGSLADSGMGPWPGRRCPVLGQSCPQWLSTDPPAPRINGVPACAHEQLLMGILREEWGFQGYVVSDEGAVELILLGHHYTHSFLETAVGELGSGAVSGSLLLQLLLLPVPRESRSA